WDAIASQFPDIVLARSRQDIATKMGSEISLPLDAIVSQLAVDFFKGVSETVDTRHLESFPMPFQPVGGMPTETTSLAAVTSLEETPGPDIREERPGVVLPPLELPLPATTSLPEPGTVEARHDEWPSERATNFDAPPITVKTISTEHESPSDDVVFTHGVLEDPLAPTVDETP